MRFVVIREMLKNTMRLAWLIRFLVGLSLPGMAAAAPLRVLFIGNSLTYVNDVPAMVQAIGKANGEKVETRMVAYPDYSLEDHWNGGDARRAIAEGGWSFVVLQQGPSSQPDSRVLLVEYAKRFAKEADRFKTRVAMYMVWTSKNALNFMDGVKLSHEVAARETGGVFLPAGEAWRIAWRRDPNLAFYGPDGFHPSKLGSFLAALVIYEGLTGKPASRLPKGVVSDAEAKLLEQASAEALGR
jgi:hypothetical protein